MIPKNFTVVEIDELIEAKKHIFSGKPYPLKIVSEEIKKFIGKVEWANGADLSDDLQKITGTDSLEKTEKVLSDWKQEVSEKPVESTVPQKEQLEKLEGEAKKRSTEAKESVQKAQTKQEQWLKLQKEKLLKTSPKEEQEKVLAELKGRVVYVTPQKPEPEIILTKEEEAFANLAKQNPAVFEKKLAQNIISKNPEIFASEELKPLADIIAVDTTSAFIDPSQKQIPTGVFAALAKYDKSPEVQKTGSLYTILSEERQNLYREILNRTVGVNLANKVLGYSETTYEFSETPPEKPEGSFSLKLDDLQANSFSLQESTFSQVFDNPSLGEAKNIVSLQLKDTAFSKIASLPKTRLLGKLSQFTTSRSFDSIAPFLGLPTQATYTGTTFFGKMITTILPQYAPLITNFTAKLGIDIGIKALAPVAAKAAGAGVAAAAGGAAVKTGLAATISTALSTTFGSFTPIVGHAIGAVVGWIAGKALEPILNWIKKHQEDLVILGGLLMGGGAILRSIPLFAFGGLIFIPTALKTGFSMAKIASRTAFIFGRIGASMAITIGTPIIVAVVVFPILVAIILFIINSGAYIVPPQLSSVPGAGGGENEFIKITKTATPTCRNSTKAGCVSGFPDVTYTVTITAKKGALTNIRFNNLYSVVGGSVAAPTPNINEINNPPESISPSADYVITYTIPLGSEYNNTAVVDTFSVTADAADQPGTSVSTNASVITGDPPIDCPIIGGSPLFKSYTPGNENEKSHGSNYYWAQSGGSACRWALPQVAGCSGPSDPRASSNICYGNSGGTCSYYGAAIDVFAAAGSPVYMPRVLGQNITWACAFAYANEGGIAGNTYRCSSGQYTLIFTHLMNNGKTGTINSGEKFGELYPLSGGPHVHIEFVINGQYVKPEDYFCSI